MHLLRKKVQWCVLSIHIALGCEAQDPELQIDIWYGQHQRFGHLGHPQRWVNVLGNVSPDSLVVSLTWSLNGSNHDTLSRGPDHKRLARPGDFNLEIHRSQLQPGVNQVVIIAVSRSGLKNERIVTVEYLETGQNWPLPYSIDWSQVTELQDVVQVVDGKWTLTKDGVRTAERYYDRVLAFGDDSWYDFEVSTTVTFHAFTPPKTPPNTTGVTHAAIATRWPGHDFDKRQPHTKWHPLGATAEFFLSPDLDQCAWRIFDGRREFFTRSERHRSIRLEKPYRMKHRVDTVADGNSRYLVKLWPADEQEPSSWDVERLELNEDVPSGSALLIAHHTDVTFGNIDVTPIVPGN